jgi:hypothetical protein
VVGATLRAGSGPLDRFIELLHADDERNGTGRNP